MAHRIHRKELLGLLLLTLAALLIHGYHLGVEDQAIYLPAIKHHLNPSLYPFDAMFFQAQTRLTLFDELMAQTVRWSHLPTDVVLFGWYLVSIFLFLLACLQLSRRCFDDGVAQWAAVTMVAVVLTLPVAGTRLFIFSEYTHPRNLATVALLFAFVAVLDRRITALAWLAVAAVLHPQMTVFGAFHLAFQAWRLPLRQSALSFPLFTARGAAWQEVLESRTHHFPLRWKWYEQLGAVAPLVLLAWFARLAKREAQPLRAHLCRRLALSGSLSVAGAVAISVLPGFERLIPVQSMRSLHLIYILLFLVGGGLLGQYVLRNRLRWILLFVPLAAVMGWAQLSLYPASPHIEWPDATSQNEWLQAFAWVRQNTPRDAFFALDPRYLERPGEDSHGFRAFAERSMLADYFKDRGQSAIFPDLAFPANHEVQDRQNWRHFGVEDFRRLRRKYHVDWVIVESPGVSGLRCPYVNERVLVCRID